MNPLRVRYVCVCKLHPLEMKLKTFCLPVSMLERDGIFDVSTLAVFNAIYHEANGVVPDAFRVGPGVCVCVLLKL